MTVREDPPVDFANAIRGDRDEVFRTIGLRSAIILSNM